MEEEEEDDVDPEDIAGVDGMDEDVEDIPEDSLRQEDGRGLNKQSNYDDERPRRKSEYEERVIEVSRVTKVVKGGKQLGFRCVLAMGDEKGTVSFMSQHLIVHDSHLEGILSLQAVAEANHRCVPRKTLLDACIYMPGLAAGECMNACASLQVVGGCCLGNDIHIKVSAWHCQC